MRNLSFSSTLVSKSQIFYAWLTCFNTKTINELIGFDLKKLKNFTVANTGVHDVYSPMTYLSERNELLGVNGSQNNLLKLMNETKPVSGTLGGIPSNNGLVGRDGEGIVYASCQHYTESVFSIVDVDKGSVQILKNNWLMNFPHFVSTE